MAKGLFIGNSHANGGIPSEIAETGTKIEIEGNEYYICNEAYNSTNHFDFKKKTNKEILDFIYTEFACKLNQDIMHSGDFIVCKVVVADNRKKDRKGTIKQILNQMQGEKNCKVESSSNYLKQGGNIKRADGSYSKRGLWDNIRANIGSGRKPTKEMLKQEAIIREKYHLGGDMSKHLAPNGKPSNLTHEQWHLVRTDAFKKWFGDWEKLAYAKFKDSGMDEITLANLSKDVSKVVDENGEPLVVFHGTANVFTIFDIDKVGKNTDTGMYGTGFYFSNDVEYANTYANRNENNSILMSLFLNLKNPLFINIKQDIPDMPEVKTLEEMMIADKIYSENFRKYLISKKYDGVISKLGYVGNNAEYVALYSNEIKLADGTNTTFDSSNPDIRYDLGGKIKVNQSEDEGNLSYFIDDKKVAYAKYYFNLESSISEKLNKYKSELYLEMIEVDKDFRNKGIAKELLKKVISIAENLKVEVVSLRRESGLGCDYGSDYDNYLKGIYESLGFVQFDVEDCAMKLVLKNRNDLGGNIKTEKNDMETEIKEYRYNLTSRPFSIGTYPSESKFGFLRFEENDRFGTVIYSKKLPLEKVKNYELSPITDIFIYDGKKMLFHNKFPANIEVKVNERNRSYVSIIPEKEGVKNIQMGSIDFLEELENGKHTIIDDSESKELEKGIAVEQEHKKTFEKVAAGDITPEQAIVETAKEHIAENPNYYDELEKMENKSDNKEMIIEQTEEIKTNIESYKNPYEVNKAIERLLDQKGDSDNYSSKELEFISYYSGYGGLEKFGKVGNERLKTLIYEFYTPDAVVKKMWALAYKYGYGTIADNSVFEPSVGIGAFLKYAPKDVKLVANEINEYSAKICEILYPNAKVELKYFEQNFLKSNLSIKSRTENLEKYSLVIGNPPYGRLDSKYTAMGEDSFTKAGNFTEYFITRGLDLLVQGGLLIYIVGAEQYNGGSLFLDSPLSKVKEIIFDKADLLDAYRLPINIFERTGVSSEIVVFKKR